MMCRLLEVSKSGFYNYLNRPTSETKKRQTAAVEKIIEIREQQSNIPGYRKIRNLLNRDGFSYSLGGVRRLCKKHGFFSCVVRKKRAPKTTDSSHNYAVSKNILNRNFKTQGLNEKCVTDITYIRMADGSFVYLSGIMDMHSRRVVGWIVDNEMKTELVSKTLTKAIRQRGVIPKQLLLHSDRGVQYSSNEFRELLKEFGVTQSMSDKGQCWDNAPCESFWGKLKREWLRGKKFKNIEEVRSSLVEYIDGYYYNQRLHQGLDYRTPREIEDENLQLSLTTQ